VMVAVLCRARALRWGQRRQQLSADEAPATPSMVAP